MWHFLCFSTSAQGYKLKNAYIITQGPMEGTCGDFWKMVHDRKCGVIVMTSDLVEEEQVHSVCNDVHPHIHCKSCHIQEVCYQYWPGSGSTVYGEYTVEFLNEEKLEGFVLRTLSVYTKVSHYIAIQYLVHTEVTQLKCIASRVATPTE